ncbi:MAG: B12-binding domain-containing radical SAM protein, partial [Polyangia bacterium]
IAFSVAYELEVTGLFDCLTLAGLPLFAAERGAQHPLVVAGGPLTFSNPLPLGGFVDVVAVGEAEELAAVLCAAVDAEPDRAKLLELLSRTEGFWVPSIHGERLPPVAKADDALLPARSTVVTPNTELRSMFLIEPERGCSRGCTYCVMRRSTNGGMRKVAPDVVLDAIPAHARRVGLVGAAVTDHPKIAEIVRRLVDGGRQIGISSLRADRLTDELVGLLARGGYRTLTTASDGASERLREVIQRKTKEKHLVRAAELARAHGMRGLKLYEMVGIPGETDDDIDELVRFGRELSKVIPLALGVAPFVAKRNTPLDGTDFAGIREVEGKLERLRKGLKGAVDVRPTSARWAWVEYVLAQGGIEAGRRALAAHQAGGSFAAWKRAFADDGARRAQLRVVQ